MMIGHVAMIGRMAVATCLGGVIGWERERQGRPAGLRTHLLVSIASATFMLVSTQFVYFQQYAPGDLVEVDASRIAASVVSGIGFLGAGAILRSGVGIQGLTTAASLWLVAAIGLASGGGMYVEAIIATAISLFCLVVLRRVEGRKGRLVVRRISLTVSDSEVSTADVLARLRAVGAEVAAVDYDRRLKAKKTSVLVDVRLKSDAELEQLVQLLEAIPGTTRIKLQRPI
ncbi:MAG: MgtC/SapB family protein [Pirellulales bacterium]|nr:MgtC/SapB family protein [Pirellulales bacterium]